MSDYMAKLQSILAPSEEVEEHFIVNGREIVGEYKHIIVEGDENSNTIYITMNDTFDGQQLYPKNIEIRYTTPDGYVGYDKPKITHSGSVIRMAWLLDGNVSRAHGKVEFSIWVTSESYEWKTLSTSFTVEKKQEAFGAEAPPPERDWVRKVIEAANTPADWNQNDETKPGYFKNRPFYETEALCICDYNEKTEYGRINPAVQMNEGITLVKGEHLLFEIIEDGKVSYDEIERLGIDGVDGSFCFKSGRFYGWEEGINNITVQTWKEAYEISVKITRPGVVKQLEEKFIPDTIARKEDVNAVIGDIDTALDEILAIQSRYIEGGTYEHHRKTCNCS